MTPLLLTLLFQSSLVLPPRTAMENPAAVSQVPQKLAKDYATLWMRFIAGKDDPKLEKDLDNFLKKQKILADPALTIEGYVHLYSHDGDGARRKFREAFALNAKNRIALYYLAEIAFENQEYAAAAGFYTELLTLDTSRSEIDTKRQRALLLAADEALRSGARAEGESRLADAEKAYRQALTMLPKEANLHQHLADLLTRENKTAEAEAERKIAGELMPRGADSPAAASNPANAGSADTLDDLGRWGGDINHLHEIRSAESITREQMAALLVRYFPQLTELRQTPQILTDVQNSWASSEIRTVVGLSLIDPLPNHTFEPSTMVTRGDLAVTMGRLMRLLRVSPENPQPIAAPDLAPTSTLYPEAQLVLGSGVMTLQNSGSFNVSGEVSGGDAVRSMERLNRIFQQLPH